MPIFEKTRHAFSLIELMVVLVLVAAISATVVVKWSGVRQSAVVDAAVSKLEFHDAHMRRYSISHNVRTYLAFEFADHKLQKQYHDLGPHPSWESIGSGVRISQLDLFDESSSSGNDRVMFERDGTSPTYGVELDGPGELQVWLLVAGASGQVIRFESAREFQDAKQILSTEN